jgi:methionine-gamma-lyase
MNKYDKETTIVHGITTCHTTSMDLVPPIHMTSTYKFSNADHGAGIFAGTDNGFVYTRISNPTIQLLEEKTALLENGEAAIATGSGMSAIASVALSLAKPGDNFISCNAIYGGTFALFSSHLKNLGIEARMLSPASCKSTNQVEQLIDGNTRFLFAETPANPTLDIIDIKMWAKLGKLHGIPLIVDNTFASPFLQNPMDLGAEIVVHSATKYLSGHGDIVGGMIVGTKKMTDCIRDAYSAHFGPIMSPFNAWLLLRGIKTLAIRMERHCESAMAVAQWLEIHPKINRVYYPGLVSHPGHSIALKQMKRFGGMIAFEVKGGIKAGKQVMDSVKLCTLAVSLGDCETLIQHPASMTHSTYTRQDRLSAGITDGLIRLSIGLENKTDIIADLEQAFSFI